MELYNFRDSTCFVIHSLAWGGLQQTSGWASKSNLEQTLIIGINDEHIAGTTGQKCP